ncbi:MAG: FAD-binding protein [Gammaproteobacteria bacterium]|nr:FAD-binding protein [Gammaproteobacteria bacterium]
MINRRNLIKKSFIGSLGTGGLLGLSACEKSSMGPAAPLSYEFTAGKPMPWINWAKNQGCLPAKRIAPQSEDELCELLKANHSSRMRPVGAGHSFSAIVPTEGTLISTDLLNGIISTDSQANTARVWGGTRLHQLGPALDSYGLGLTNWPDINYQTLAGAISTSTHGSGAALGSLSSMVNELTIATPAGELITCSASTRPELFNAARCGLGALGIITQVNLDTTAAFNLAQTTAVEPLADVLNNIDQEKERNRHFEFLAFPHTSQALVVRTNPIDAAAPITRFGEEDPTAIYQIREAYQKLGILPLVGEYAYQKVIDFAADGAETLTSGPSYSVLTHDRVVPFREMEYTVPADAGPACLEEILSRIARKKIPVIFPIEYRYTQQDNIWLSMFCEQEGCSISIHQFADEDYREYFAEIEPIFRKYAGRPHWGKLHTLGSQALSELYPHWADFLAVRNSIDPAGRLLNEHLTELFGLTGNAHG